MRRQRQARFLLVLALVLAGVLPPGRAVAQESADASAPSLVPLEELRLRLLPMRRAALDAEAESWMDRLETKVRAVSDADIAARSAEGDALASIVARAAELGVERDAILERTETVVAALGAKGGDVEEYEQYIAAATRPTVTVTDATGLSLAVRKWLASPDGGIGIAINIAKFLGILLVFWIVARILAGIVDRALRALRRTSKLLRDFLVGLTRRATMLVGAVVAVSMLGVNVGPLVAAIGAAGLVIGFALQGTLSNFASGIMILIYHPFDVGDSVTAGGVSGKVESMTLVSTVIVTFDNQQMIVPNNAVWQDVITNVTGRDRRRVDMTFGIGYDADIDKARSVLEDVVRNQDGVFEDPAPVVQLHELADSSVNFIVRPWAKTEDYWKVRWGITGAVKRRFDQEGIGIPFPQMDVHVDGSLAGAAGLSLRAQATSGRGG